MIQNGQKIVGPERITPIVLGPVTLCALAKYSGGATASSMLDKLIPAYVQLLTELAGMSVPEVQMHEPCLVLEEACDLKDMFEIAYAAMSKVGIPINLVSYFDDLDPVVMKWSLKLPGISVLSLDFTRGNNLASLKSCDFPTNVTLGAGVIDGRSVWADGNVAAELLQTIRETVGVNVSIRVQPSCSLQYLPYDLDAESELSADIKNKLAFAKQKLSLITDLANGRTSPTEQHHQASTTGTEIPEEKFSRPQNFETRRPQQFSVPGGFATNSIGSFPQTTEIRKLRLRFKNGAINRAEYETEVDKYISNAIKVQEDLDFDIFVHGEPERSDMVEFFGQSLAGMTFTLHGWVQSYGSRYVDHGDGTRSRSSNLCACD
jgi:5-methyltetrahydropteroyltriglutamate--homocysteine methyltransferase